ncbi:MAG: LuxR C-terminal-related transcriptional regulator, partial [Holosporaceae bacterium]|nr:LuxR C-terminal-related transcriptional regulator [Holosporaceae bacterium]
MNSIKSLSNRELDVLACVAARCSNKETAKLLNISPRTAETHVRHILIKIGCFTREAAIDFLKKTDLRDELQKRYEKISQTSFFTKIDREKHIRRTICAAATVTMLLSPLAFKIFETGDQTVEERGYFMRRKSIDKQIEAALCKEKRISIIVLIGCGGAGKTALARKHLLKLRADFKFEINADAENSILNSMFDLADKLATDKESKEELKFIAGIPNEIEKRKKLLNFIQNRMKKLPNWAIILDNLEDLKYLKEFCPNNPEVWGTGKVIITTRNENIKTVRYLGDIDAISVGELEEDEKAELFESVSGIPPNKETANFLKQIPGYPLDVFTAACYIKISGISLSEYLKRTSEISDEFVTVSKRLMAESLNYDKTRYGIVTSNFREILSKNKSFGELLLLICLFDSQKIPLKILRQMSGAVVADNLISYLKQYSVVSCDGDEASIHRSVQSIGLDYLSKEMRLSEKSAFLKKAISICAPYDCLKATYTNSVKLIPHLKAFLEKMDKLLVPNAERYKTLLLITIGDIYRFGEC